MILTIFVLFCKIAALATDFRLLCAIFSKAVQVCAFGSVSSNHHKKELLTVGHSPESQATPNPKKDKIKLLKISRIILLIIILIRQ